MSAIDRKLPKGKKQKSNQINERWIRRKNHDKSASEDKKQKTQKSKLLNLKIKKHLEKTKFRQIVLRNS